MAEYTYRCPKCGDTDSIDVCADIWVRLVQSGVDGEFESDPDLAANHDHEFDDNHGAVCQACGYNGNLDKFAVEDEDDAPGLCTVHGVQCEVDEMSKILVSFELEPIGADGELEANGRVYYFCSAACRSSFDGSGLPGVLQDGVSPDAIEGTVCDQCGVDLEVPHV